MWVNYLQVMKIYRGITKNTAVINAANATDLIKICTAVFLSAIRSSADPTFEIFPSRSKLKVPARPYARQNFDLD